ncbi:MAG: aldolase/citrate lyase family protein [Spirochaetia bacterium]|jgi:4-hydroxy-2-oxoheptanedioate aldolase|nr:aldolase/citrate lyase family protein [Spirochaetia bacterium]
MKNRVREKLKSGEKVIGTFFEIGGCSAVECLGIAGLDFLVIDTEHGPFDVESTMDFIRAAELKGITPFVRVKDGTRPSVLKMLDIGAKGLIIPCVNTVDEVRKIVEYGKYYPAGNRGFFFGRAASYGYDDAAGNIETWFDVSNRETLLIPQCETAGCLENIEEIVNINGVDGIFIGPYDLSIGMEKPAQFDDPEFLAAVKRILKACNDAGKFSFIYTVKTGDAKKYLNSGFSGVAVNTDVSVFINAFKSIIAEVKEG